MNVAVLVGRLGKDPELKYTEKGTAVINISLCTQDRKDKPTWHQLTIWGEQAENFVKCFKKGYVCEVTGQIEYQEWKDAHGQERQKTVIVVRQWGFGPSSKKSGGAEQAEPQPEGKPETGDDLPF